MKMSIQGNDLILKEQEAFNLKHIFECGQCFRWHASDMGGYEGVALGQYLHVIQEDDQIRFKNTTLEAFEERWASYFDLERDYKKLKSTIAEFHPVLKEAVAYGYGIRLLKQDPWETLMSFIISANNNIPRIQMLVEKLALHYGSYLGRYQGKDYYGFPTPEQLSHVTENELRALGMGYRAVYLKEVVNTVVENAIDLGNYQHLNTSMLEKELLAFKGVGPKVAACVLIFGYGRLDTFPVDTWIRKVVSEWFQLNPKDTKGLKAYLDEKFQGLEGLVQQYLFYYAREHKLGQSKAT